MTSLLLLLYVPLLIFLLREIAVFLSLVLARTSFQVRVHTRTGVRSFGSELKSIGRGP